MVRGDISGTEHEELFLGDGSNGANEGFGNDVVSVSDSAINSVDEEGVGHGQGIKPMIWRKYKSVLVMNFKYSRPISIVGGTFEIDG